AAPRRPAARPGQRPAAAAPLRGRGPATATVRGGAAANGRAQTTHGRRRFVLLLGGLGLVAVVALAALLLSGGGSDTPSSARTAAGNAPTQQTSSASSRTTSAAAPPHGKITVAVLNGTPTAGLASTVANTLAADGFARGPVTNASDQQRSVTVVSYFGGHETEAQEVAKTLNVPSDAVQPIDADTEAACAQGGTCAATVVVTVGADRQ
ncbi:MAG: LytR C-terminal domain-containing protein, partial [Actinobacteria bacterium]|nr:LytR C-terminal domain-containing protein [Actinomycetota bacterium]